MRTPGLGRAAWPRKITESLIVSGLATLYAVCNTQQAKVCLCSSNRTQNLHAPPNVNRPLNFEPFQTQKTMTTPFSKCDSFMRHADLQPFSRRWNQGSSRIQGRFRFRLRFIRPDIPIAQLARVFFGPVPTNSRNLKITELAL